MDARFATLSTLQLIWRKDLPMAGMGMGDLLFSFEGRISRSGFWIGVLVQFIILVILAGVGGAARSNVVWVILGVIYIMTVVWMSLAISIKRWHDRGKSGWWVLIGLVPVVGAIWAFIETAMLSGDDGPNEYGADPLAA